MEEQEKKVRRHSRKAVPAQYRRKLSMKMPLLLVGGLLFCAIAVAVIVLQPWNNGDNTEKPAPLPDKVIHLVAGGNINITDESVAAGETANGYDFAPVFKDVLPVLASGDVTILNFEGIVGGNTYGTATKYAPPELLKALKNAGVDVLQTANSYALYDSLRGLSSTIQGIQGAGMTPLGTYSGKADFEQSGGYIIWEVKGIKIAMMAFTKGMVDSGGLPTENCVNLLYEDYQNTFQKVDTDGITKIVRNAAAHNPDVMIALVHWGSELSNQVSKTQKKICQLLQDEGVDAIIGTHPHNVQKMELDKENGTFVAWSLGDLYDTVEANYSVLLDLEITKDGETGETKVTGFDYVPVYLEKDEDGSMRILRMQEAIAGYENRYLDRVSEKTYNAMKTALEQIKNRINAK